MNAEHVEQRGYPFESITLHSLSLFPVRDLVEIGNIGRADTIDSDEC
jgi:hypothetical protein